ncbi:MAG: hypothetical protein ACI9VN_000125 [Patescibacteria group bacterium]|jgi:hypothetical protein
MKHLIAAFLCLFFFYNATGQDAKQGIAILDLSERNGETNDARLFSAEHICKVVGFPFIITADIEEAATYKMVLCSSKLMEQTFNDEEEERLIEYVANGGLLLSPRVEDEDLYELFGVSGYEGSNARYTFAWDTDNQLNNKELRWIDEPEEITMSLGRDSYDAIYKTLGYMETTGRAVAHFADNTAAVVSNNYGEGHAVVIGLSLKEIVLRNQINRDYEAQRLTSNGFEPTSDALFLFVRALYAAHYPFATWKHSSPGNSSATVMVTHDIDSKTGMDTLRYFVDYEQAHNIEATYNVTVRYFDDDLMSPFYLNQGATMAYIRDHGQAFGSHSIGHFFDFADQDIFPIGQVGSTPDMYSPYNDGDITVGGTVYGECEVSKNVLEEDIGINIRTFRAGHLAYPKYLVNVLDSLGYEYNTTHSAADVLTNFPYQNKMGRSFSGLRSSVYEIPVTISDVFHANPISNENYLDKAATWLDVTLKNRANGAPSVLLIHPNRQYKLVGMDHYLESLPDDVYIGEMNRFGDFWKVREEMGFVSHVFNNEMTILIPSDVNLEDNVSFVINDGQSLDAVFVKDEQNNVLDFSVKNWDGNDLLVFHEYITTTPVTISNNVISEKNMNLNVFPNPANFKLNIELELEKLEHIKIDLFDVDGKKVKSIMDGKLGAGTHRWIEKVNKTAAGIYFLIGETQSGSLFKKKVVLH